jgi:hypothetical protein
MANQDYSSNQTTLILNEKLDSLPTDTFFRAKLKENAFKRVKEQFSILDIGHIEMFIGHCWKGMTKRNSHMMKNGTRQRLSEVS